MKTRLYTVHLLDNARDDGLVLVKQGFNWPAFFIAVPWALFHRMWRAAAVLIVLQIIIGAAMAYGGLNETQQGIVSLVVAICIGYAADEMRRSALSRRGYSFEAVVIEENRDRALRRFLEGRPGLASRLAAGRAGAIAP